MQAHQKVIASVLLIAAGLIADDVAAQAVGSGLRVGTPGIGLSLGSDVTERFGIRGPVNRGSLSHDYDESSIRYDSGVRFGTGILVADWHPYASGFRLTGGLVYNNQRFDGTARPGAGMININGTDYAAAQIGSLDGRVRFSRASPYVGVGWGLAPWSGSRLYFSADLGVTYQRPSASLIATCSSALPFSACTQLQGDIRAEEAESRYSTDELRFYPVISVGFGLRF